ncbi:MAG: YjbQ family protein, partial [Candidatus Lokiarchaeota archaeon]|nr:YjbQ family protein [Candidatus Lokiarchaeota archaeon]
VTINENADVDVQLDLIEILRKLVPKDDYRHVEGNSDAHLKSTLVGCSTECLISDSKLVLGTWQTVYFCEFDGPRTRKIHIQIIGNK